MKKFTLALTVLATFGMAQAKTTVPEAGYYIITNADPDIQARWGVVMNNADPTGDITFSETASTTSVWQISAGETEGTTVIKNVTSGGYLFSTDYKATAEATDVYVYISEAAGMIRSGVEAYGFSLKADAGTVDAGPNNGGERVFLNANWNTNACTVWTLTKGSSWYLTAIDYKEGMTSEEIQAAYEGTTAASALDKAKAAAIEELRKYFEYSENGSGCLSWGFDMFIGNPVNACTSEEELETVKANITAQAVTFLTNQLAQNFIWKLNREATNGNPAYLSYDSSNADSQENSVWQAAEQLNMNCIWIAEYVNAGEQGGIDPKADGEDEGDKKEDEKPETTRDNFRLKNLGSGYYIGAPRANSTMGYTANAEEAATMYLYAKDGMIVIRLEGQNDEPALNYCNVSNSDMRGLVYYWEIPDAGADFTYLVPAKSELKTDIEVVGANVGEWGMVTAEKIETVKFSIPKGAEMTPEAQIAVYAYQPDWSMKFICGLSNEQMSEIIAAGGEEGEAVEVRGPGSIEVNEEGWYVEVPGPVLFSYTPMLYTWNLPEVITEEGSYVLQMPDGAFYIVENDEFQLIDGAGLSVTIEGEPTYFSLSVTPAEGLVEAIETIAITAEESFGVNWYNFENIVIKKEGAEMPVLSIDGDSPEFSEKVIDPAEWETTLPEYYIAANITEPGNYTMVIPTGFFENDNQEPSEEVIVMWTIDEQSGISNITVNGAAVNTVYDLQGRKVSKATNGIYIINGVKTLVK